MGSGHWATGLSVWPKLMMVRGPALRQPTGSLAPQDVWCTSRLCCTTVLSKEGEAGSMVGPDSLALRSTTSVQDGHLRCVLGDATAPVPQRYRGHAVPTYIPRKDW